MLGQTQECKSSQFTVAGYSAGDKPLEYGVSSAIGDLQGEIRDIANQAVDIRGVIGIPTPNQLSGDSPVESSSLVNVLRAMIQVLRSANSDLSDTLRHLRS